MKDDFWVEEPSGQPSVGTKRKRRVGKRKLEFIEWASRPLIGFLEAIGEDPREKHSRHEVAAFISKYINEKGLASAQKKKKVLCDKILFALFGKKSVSRIKVYDLLEEHFAENHDDSDDDSLDSSGEENYREKTFSGSKGNGQTKKVPETPKSCFAAVIPENIKLVHLKRSLILELLKVPESFENKIVGSFIRMKCDPNDAFQKNPFQLQLVTGIEKISGAGDEGSEIQLKVSNFFKDIPISMLSEDNFSKEEVEDVQDRIKAGLLKRLTVNELELKAQMLHVDITKHAIAKELSLLQRKIEHANEKGWRRDYTLFEYLDRRKMLQTPCEVEKLLLKMPQVIAEEPEPEATIADPAENAEGSSCSPTFTVKGISKVSSTDVSVPGAIVTPREALLNDLDAPKVQDEGIDETVPVKTPNGYGDTCQTSQRMDGMADGPADIQHETKPAEVIYNQNNRMTQVINAGGNDIPEKPKQAVGTTQVIELSDDESEDEDPRGGESLDPSDMIWHYMDPQGQTWGPFSLYSLKRWSDANYFHANFIVWRSGQTSKDGVLLVDVLRHAFRS